MWGLHAACCPILAPRHHGVGRLKLFFFCAHRFACGEGKILQVDAAEQNE